MGTGQQQWPSAGLWEPGVDISCVLEVGGQWWPSTGCQYLNRARRASRWIGS